MRHTQFQPGRIRWTVFAVAVSLFAGMVVESDAGTRFSNRKSRADSLRGSSGKSSSSERKGLFARARAKRQQQQQSVRRVATQPQRPATRAVTAKPEKKKRSGWLFARLRDRDRGGSGDRSSERSRRTRTTKKRTAPRAPSAKINHSVLASSNKGSNRVVVDISKQRAYLLVDGRIAVDSPISSARAGKYTPRGTFYMTQRVPVGKVSTIYHVEMPYWMRLSNTVFGMHAGYLPGYPASAGCVRLSSDGARAIYNHTRAGTQVRIYSSWSGG